MVRLFFEGAAPARIPIVVSGAMLRQQFHPCDLDYIRSVCRGRCCQGSKGILVTVHESERERIGALGAVVEAGFIQPDSRGLCPFKTDDGLCSIHDKKPFGCACSPFTLNRNDTLIVRNRYRMLRCYGGVGSRPAYEAHRFSLIAVLGEEEAARVAALVVAGEEKISANMGATEYQMMKDNDAAKRGRGK